MGKKEIIIEAIYHAKAQKPDFGKRPCSSYSDNEAIAELFIAYALWRKEIQKFLEREWTGSWENDFTAQEREEFVEVLNRIDRYKNLFAYFYADTTLSPECRKDVEIRLKMWERTIFPSPPHPLLTLEQVKKALQPEIKTYTYKIDLWQWVTPFLLGEVWHSLGPNWDKLRQEMMNEAQRILKHIAVKFGICGIKAVDVVENMLPVLSHDEKFVIQVKEGAYNLADATEKLKSHIKLQVARYCNPNPEVYIKDPDKCELIKRRKILETFARLI